MLAMLGSGLKRYVFFSCKVQDMTEMKHINAGVKYWQNMQLHDAA